MGRPIPWFLAAWIAQIALALALPLLADEAYYRAWASRPALGYLDHPPLIAWWIAAGGGHPRLLGLLLVPAALWLLADAARRFGVPRPARVPALLAWTPLGFGVAVVATPDAPLLVGWCGVLWAVAARRPWLVGLLFGACLWAKSAALVALPGLLWVLGRRAPLAAALAVAVYAPHVVWSAANEGLPWTFQAQRGWTGFHLPEVLLGQLGLATPGLFLLAVVAWRRAGADPTDRVLRALGLPVLLAWLAVSTVTRVEANWPLLAWPATALLLLRRDPSGLPRAWAFAAVLTGLAALGAVLAHQVLPPSVGPPRDPDRLRACLAGAGGWPVAARYQEKALASAAGVDAGWLRAAGHRPSEYDRGRLDVGPSVPECGFLYLAGPKALAGRCSGPVVADRACGLPVTRCECP